MAEMAAMGEIQTHQPAVRGHDGLVDLEVGGAAAQALDVDTPLGAVDVEGGQGAVLAEGLDLVDVLVATVVASAGVALRVLVGHGRSEGIEDGTGRDVLGSNEDDGLALALDLMFLGRRVSRRARHGSDNKAKLTMISATSGSESRSDFSSIYRR